MLNEQKPCMLRYTNYNNEMLTRTATRPDGQMDKQMEEQTESQTNSTQLMFLISLYLEQWTCTTRTANLFYLKKFSVVVLYEAKTIETMWRN